MTITAFPLTWPQGFPRGKFNDNGQFRSTLSAALNNVQDSLRRFASDSGKKLDSLIISSNVTLGELRPADPGVAVWFVWDGLSVCIAVDRYSKVESNLQAIHLILEARRTELRHGTLALVRATFTGFKALPAPVGSNWWEVLDVDAKASRADIDARYKKLRSQHHPDNGGDAARFNVIQKAFEQATKS